MLRFGRTVVALAILFAVAAPAAHAADCTTTVSSISAASSAVNAAAQGATVCLADGNYGKLTLSATKAGPGVTVRAAHPGQATLAGAYLDGKQLTLAQFVITSEVTIRPPAAKITIDHNKIVGGSGMGVNLWTGASPTLNDIAITGNQFVGVTGEDQIRANGYHDADGDGVGLLVEGNEFTGNQELGDHNDVFQAVWVGDHLVFRRNYLHDFGGQGFFVKDQTSPINGLVVEDNLIVRQNLPCNPTSLCPTWSLAPFHVFGAISNGSIRHNTVWPRPTAQGSVGSLLRETGWSNVVASDNVLDVAGRDTAVTTTGANNTRCSAGGSAAWTGMTTDCSPAFLDAANGDYRQANGRGVTWSVADQHYGPGSESSPPVPGDTTAPHTTITSAPALLSLDRSATIAFAVDEAGATSQCRLDAGAWALCTSPYVVSGLGLGVHTAHVRSTDAAGNAESPGASASWTVIALPSEDPGDADPADEDPADDDEDAAPTVDLTSPTAGSLSAREMKLAARARDDHGVRRVEFWVDRTRVSRDTRAPYTARYDARSLRAGSHKVTVRAYDTAGQLAMDSVTVRVKTKARAHSASSNRSRSA
jgi:hypothetical protein